jgi:hypothetical protein
MFYEIINKTDTINEPSNLTNQGLLAQKWAILGVESTEWYMERVLF